MELGPGSWPRGKQIYLLKLQPSLWITEKSAVTLSRLLSQPIIRSLLPLMVLPVVVLVVKRSVNSILWCSAGPLFLSWLIIPSVLSDNKTVCASVPCGAVTSSCFSAFALQFKKKKKKHHTCIHKCPDSSIIIWGYGKILLCILVTKSREQNVNHSIGTNVVPFLIHRCLNLLLLFRPSHLKSWPEHLKWNHDMVNIQLSLFVLC